MGIFVYTSGESLGDNGKILEMDSGDGSKTTCIY